MKGPIKKPTKMVSWICFNFNFFVFPECHMCQKRGYTVASEAAAKAAAKNNQRTKKVAEKYSAIAEAALSTAAALANII